MKGQVYAVAIPGLFLIFASGAFAVDIPPFVPGPFPEDPLIYDNSPPGWLDPREALPEIPDIPPPGGVRWWLSDDEAMGTNWPQGWLQQDGFNRDRWKPPLGPIPDEEWFLLTDVHWWGTYGYYTTDAEGDPYFHADPVTNGKIPLSDHVFKIELVKTDDTLIPLTFEDGVENLYGYAPAEPGPLLGGNPPMDPETPDEYVPVYGYAAHVDPLWIYTGDLKGIRIALDTIGTDSDNSSWYWVTSEYEANETTQPPSMHSAYQGLNDLDGWGLYNDDLAFQLTGTPEPGTMVILFGIGAGMTFAKRLRKKQPPSA